ncbi:MAG: beta strand repeat-containing protein, partial [Phycisphaerae bacterium]
TDAFASATDVTVAAGATLDMSGIDEDFGALLGTGAVINNNGDLNIGNGNETFSLTADITGSGSITKSGTGDMDLGTGFSTDCPEFNINGGRVGTLGRFPDDIALTIGAAGTLDMGFPAGRSEQVGSLAGSGDLLVPGGTFTVGGLNTSTTFSGVISGDGTFVKTGTGTLTLSGANTAVFYDVNGGALRLGGANRLPTGARVTVAAGANLDMNGNVQTVALLQGAGNVINNNETMNGLFVSGSVAAVGNPTYSGAISGSGAVLKSGDNTWTLTGNNTFTNRLQIVGGVVALGPAGQLSDSCVVFPFAGAALDLSQRTASETVGNLTGDGNITNNVNGFVFGGNNGNASFGGTVTGAGALSKQGTGTWTLNGTIAPTPFNINGGTVTLGAANRIGNSTDVNIAAGATFNMNNFDDVIGAVSGAGNITNISRIEMNATNSTTYSGVLSGTGNLFKDNPGTWTISGANTLSGDWSIRGGTLKLGVEVDSIPETSSVSISSGATWDMMNFGEDVGGLAGAGRVINVPEKLITTTPLDFGANGVATEFSGQIEPGGGGAWLRKNGAATWTLSGTFSPGWLDVIGGSVLIGPTTTPTGVLDRVIVNLNAAANTLDLNGTSQTLGGLSGSGNVLRNSAVAGLTVNNQAAETFSGTIAGSGPVTKGDTGVWTLTGALAITSRLNIQAGTVRLGGADIFGLATDIDINAGATLDINSNGEEWGGLTGAGSIINNIGSGIDVGNGNETFAFGGTINGTAAVRKDGTGVFTLDGSIGGGGDVIVGNGTFRFGSAGSVATNCDVTVEAGALFDMNGTGEVMGGLYGAGNTINHSDDLFLNVATSGDYAGVISEPNPPTTPGDVIKRSAGTWRLLNIQAFKGLLDVEAGTVLLGPGGNLDPACAVNVDANTTFDLGGRSQTIRGLSGAGNVINANVTGLAINGADSNTFSGVISGAGRVTKAGAGVQRHTGANTYTGGTTISGGRLVIDNTTGSGTGTGAVTVGNTATLNGDGSISGAVTINSGGTLAPGGTLGSASAPGSLGLGSTVAFGATAVYDVEIGGASAGTQYDQVIAIGNATLNGTLRATLINGFAPTNGQTFQVLIAGGRSGTFANTNLPPGFTIEYSGGTVTLRFEGVSGRGDLDCNGMVNNFDINPFVLAIADPAAYALMYPGCDLNRADINGDGLVNNFDINGFVDCILNGACP